MGCREAPLRTGTLAGAEPCPILSGSLDALWEARERGTRGVDAPPRLEPGISGRDRSSVSPATIVSPSRRQYQVNGRRPRYGEPPSAVAHDEGFPSHPLLPLVGWSCLRTMLDAAGAASQGRAASICLDGGARGNTVTQTSARER
jgi:hypothetical protein